MEITPTKHGLRMSQHGVVVSELRSTPGPTHSVFDVLAALIAVLAPAGRIGVLGFAGGGMMAPLRSLGMTSPIDAVDLDRAGYDLFRQHCRKWAGRMHWRHADAVDWLRQQSPEFGLLLDDLSVPHEGDVIKPAICWNVLPKLIRQRLQTGGIGIFNLLPPCARWKSQVEQIAGLFGMAHLIDLDEYQNRILVAGQELPPVRQLGRTLRRALRRLRSRQAGRIHLRNISEAS